MDYAAIRRTLHLDFSRRLHGIVVKIDEDENVAKLRKQAADATKALSLLPEASVLLSPAEAEEYQQSLEGALSSVQKALKEIVFKYYFAELINCGCDALGEELKLGLSELHKSKDTSGKKPAPKSNGPVV